MDGPGDWPKFRDTHRERLPGCQTVPRPAQNGPAYSAGALAPATKGLYMHVLAEIGNGQILWDIAWLFMFIIWFWLLITVFGDIFRSHDMGGFGKTLWIIFVIVLPYLGVFVYLIARGKSMQERNIAAMQAQEDATRKYVQSVAGSSPSASEELAKLADLKDKGVLTEAEFATQKAKILS